MESKKEIVNIEKASENEYVKKLAEDLKSSLGKDFQLTITDAFKKGPKAAFLSLTFTNVDNNRNVNNNNINNGNNNIINDGNNNRDNKVTYVFSINEYGDITYGLKNQIGNINDNDISTAIIKNMETYFKNRLNNEKNKEIKNNDIIETLNKCLEDIKQCLNRKSQKKKSQNIKNFFKRIDNRVKIEKLLKEKLGEEFDVKNSKDSSDCLIIKNNDFTFNVKVSDKKVSYLDNDNVSREIDINDERKINQLIEDIQRKFLAKNNIHLVGGVKVMTIIGRKTTEEKVMDGLIDKLKEKLKKLNVDGISIGFVTYDNKEKVYNLCATYNNTNNSTLKYIIRVVDGKPLLEDGTEYLLNLNEGNNIDKLAEYTKNFFKRIDNRVKIKKLLKEKLGEEFDVKNSKDSSDCLIIKNNDLTFNIVVSEEKIFYLDSNKVPIEIDINDGSKINQLVEDIFLAKQNNDNNIILAKQNNDNNINLVGDAAPAPEPSKTTGEKVMDGLIDKLKEKLNVDEIFIYYSYDDKEKAYNLYATYNNANNSTLKYIIHVVDGKPLLEDGTERPFNLNEGNNIDKLIAYINKRIHIKKHLSQLEKVKREANRIVKQVLNLPNKVTDLSNDLLKLVHHENKEQSDLDGGKISDTIIDALVVSLRERFGKYFNVKPINHTICISTDPSDSFLPEHCQYNFDIECGNGKISIKHNGKTVDICNNEKVDDKIVDIVAADYDKRFNDKCYGVDCHQLLFDRVARCFDKDFYHVKKGFRKGEWSTEITSIANGTNKPINFIVYIDASAAKIYEYNDDNSQTEIFDIGRNRGTPDRIMGDKVYEYFLTKNIDNLVQMPQNINNSSNVITNKKNEQGLNK